MHRFKGKQSVLFHFIFYGEICLRPNKVMHFVEHEKVLSTPSTKLNLNTSTFHSFQKISTNCEIIYHSYHSFTSYDNEQVSNASYYTKLTEFYR